MTQQGNSSKKKVALLSNVTVDLVAAQVRTDYEIYMAPGYDTWIQESLDCNSGLYLCGVDAAVILLDCTAYVRSPRDEWAARLDNWSRAVAEVAKRLSPAPVFVSTIDVRTSGITAPSEKIVSYETEHDWLCCVNDIAERWQNIFVFDLKATVTNIGRDNFYSDKLWYLASMPWSKTALEAMSRSIKQLLGSAFLPRRKVIVLDLDNTLWGGVVGEDGVDGIELSRHGEGQRFYDFQQCLSEMKDRGVVLAINSKNNEEDAQNALQNHPDMVLRDADFVAEKINWESKANNIAELVQELNITEGGFIFIDDNPVERGEVSAVCTSVLVPEFPSDTTMLSRFAEELWSEYLCPLKVLDTDKNKTAMYRAESQRRTVMHGSSNVSDYLAKLGMIADFHEMRPDEQERVVQLINKTNQFNLTTKRYTQSNIETISKDSNSVIIVGYLKDSYGDSGLVSVLIAKKQEDCVMIDSLLMSCRVMGRKLEELHIDSLISALPDDCIVEGVCIPTAKNMPVQGLYDRLGFDLVSDSDGIKVYNIGAGKYATKARGLYKSVICDVGLGENWLQ